MKSSQDNTPKTPGGISKTLLTPCRRLGLSRKINRKGPSPFISPLSRTHNTTEITKESEKKKICTTSEKSDFTSQAHEKTLIEVPETIACMSSPNQISNTPSRNVAFSKKNSKVLLMMQDLDAEKQGDMKYTGIDGISPQYSNKTPSKLARVNSKKKITVEPLESDILLSEISKEDSTKFKKDSDLKHIPNNLNKECIVLIQRKMLKNLKTHHDNNNSTNKVNMKNTAVSQTLFDSDSDDLPLCTLNNKQDKDFVETLLAKNKTNSYSTPKTKKSKNSKLITEKKIMQNSFGNDDDDFDLTNNRTILVKKTYQKVVKPSKAKSTGSITQKDIDELKYRIEMKKKLLIAKAITEDTEELRSLIKKWQKGCQEALFELCDLMKKKFPDNQNMDYSEILQTLKIPSELVGYDIDNDCFITPDDSNIILSSINT